MIVSPRSSIDSFLARRFVTDTVSGALHHHRAARCSLQTAVRSRSEVSSREPRRSAACLTAVREAAGRCCRRRWHFAHSTHGHPSDNEIRSGDCPSVPIFSLVSASFDVSGPDKSKQSKSGLSMAIFGRSPDHNQKCRWMSTNRRWLRGRDCGRLRSGNSRRLEGGKRCRLYRRDCRRLSRRQLGRKTAK